MSSLLPTQSNRQMTCATVADAYGWRMIPPPCHGRRYGHNERQVVDYVRTVTAKNVWYYRDRMSVPRGPCTLPVLREAWVR